jgi:hypothetical protein
MYNPTRALRRRKVSTSSTVQRRLQQAEHDEEGPVTNKEGPAEICSAPDLCGGPKKTMQAEAGGSKQNPLNCQDVCSSGDAS